MALLRKPRRSSVLISIFTRHSSLNDSEQLFLMRTGLSSLKARATLALEQLCVSVIFAVQRKKKKKAKKSE